MKAKVSTETNEMLIRPPSDAEVKRALFGINPEKSPGPDGMTSLFFQRFWSYLGKDLIRMVKDFFATGTFDPRLT